MVKICTTCGQTLALAEFYKDKRCKDECYSECKACVGERRKRDRSKARETEAAYRQRNREKLRQKSREYYAENKEKCNRASSEARRKRKERERPALQ